MAILDRHAFTTDRLSRVAYSIAMAMAALDMDPAAAANARMQGAQALESVRGQVSAQQLAQMQQQMNVSMQALDQIQDQPKCNLELVKKHRAALEAAFK